MATELQQFEALVDELAGNTPADDHEEVNDEPVEGDTPEGADEDAEEPDGDADPGDADAGDEQEVESPADDGLEAEPGAQQVSSEMAALARFAGLPDSVIEIARTNQELEVLVTRFGKQPKESPDAEADVEESDLLTWELSDDEFDPENPVLRQQKRTHDETAKKLKELQSTLVAVVGRIQEADKSAENARLWEIQSPYDEALDELDDPKFGTRKSGLSKEQLAERGKAFNHYLALQEDAPPEDRARLARLVLEAKFNIPTTSSRDDARKQQAQKKLGTNGRKKMVPTESELDIFARKYREIQLEKQRK